jgi:predicted ATP-grasp superfamily ATP-dependent carboligase
MPGVAWVDDGPNVLKPGAVLLSSFPSAGLAATVAAQYIVQTLNLPRIGIVTAPDSASVAIVQSGQVQPAVRVHGRADLAIVLSEFPVSPRSSPEVARMILDGAERLRARLVIGLEGVFPHPPDEEGEEEPEPKEEFVWAAMSRPDPAWMSQLQSARARPLSDGVIGGVSGALLVEALRRPVPVGVLLVSARPSDEGFPDHRAGAALIETLDRLLPDLKIDTGPLRSRAEIIERALRSALKSRAAREQTAEPDLGREAQTLYS